ncbi:MAG: bifunctional acetate--CoA ligase family protein/GNAT family N-acetyltransferase [Pseudomonadota bacterium]
MGLYNLDRIFFPKSIAVIGASEKEKSIGYALMKNLVDGGFEGNLIPVNPKYRKIFGIEAVPSVSGLKSRIDLVVIASPIRYVSDIINECTSIGVGGAIIISAGGKEIGEEGKNIEEKIRQNARKGSLRILGPNCLGLIHPAHKINASFATEMPTPGRLAFISQSGAICTAILDLAFQENIGFSHFVSMGSMLDVDFGDMIDYLGNDPKVGSIILYIESLTNHRKFMSAARAVSRVKPIVVLKSGRSAAGARAAASHTGAMAGEDMVFDAAFQRAGIVRVDTIEELFNCAELMAKQPRPKTSNLVIITNGGGPGVMAADSLARFGVDPTPLKPETLKALDGVLPPFWSHNNPIDMLGDATAERYAKTLEICAKDKNIGGIMVIMAPQALSDPEDVAKTLVKAVAGKNIPIFTSWMGGKTMSGGIETLNQAGIPTYETPEKAVRAFLYMVSYARNLEMLREIPPRFSMEIRYDRSKVTRLIENGLKDGSGGMMPEDEARSILEAYGIRLNPVEIARSEEDAVFLADRMGYPLVMKVFSPDISHKTEAGGVHLDLRSGMDIRSAYLKIMTGAQAYKPGARVLGVSLQPYIEKPDYEILIGAKRDDNFGPVVLFGLGGIFTEVLNDRAVGLPPLNRLLARRLMEETKAYRLLKGYRNRPAAKMELLEEMLVRLAHLIMDFPEIAELDMNPVAVRNGIPIALDARILLKPCEKPCPQHLVISPYPVQHERRESTKTGLNLFIRPIQPEDAPLLVDLFNVLSRTSIYYRFFRHVKSLTPEMLARFTQIDYDREIALITFDADAKKERILGVARIISHPDGRDAEFAIVIGDPWQGKGIGPVILLNALRIARDQKIEKVWGTVLPDNLYMRKLGRRLGFSIKYNRESELYDLTIDLKTARL